MARRKKRRSPGSGSIRKIKGKFKASYPNPDGGHWTKTFHTFQAAEAWLASFAERKDEGLL